MSSTYYTIAKMIEESATAAKATLVPTQDERQRNAEEIYKEAQSLATAERKCIYTEGLLARLKREIRISKAWRQLRRDNNG